MATCPDYRVRLFLSVDLVGSTAFKGNSEPDADVLYPEWVESFRQFYNAFPARVDAIYNESKLAAADGEKFLNGGPKVWKTIGDEILFCARVNSIRHLACCITSFLGALDAYGKLLENSGVPLDVKGSGWLATFPAHNISISVQSNTESAGSSVSHDATEEFEQQVDASPLLFDFLGKDIDAGFRIAKNASTDRFTSSLELSFLLAQASLQDMFSGRFTYHGKETFKGVIRNQPYPVISIDTERDFAKRNLRYRERLLTKEVDAPPQALQDFLSAFMNYEGIEIPVLPVETGSHPPPKPASYERFKSAWSLSFKETEERDESIEASEAVANQSGLARLDDVITDFAKQVRSESFKSSLNHVRDNFQQYSEAIAEFNKHFGASGSAKKNENDQK
ncbi:hypothetical protein FY152_04210 [Agrobacterium tumefaciens]|nr:hypothetical protein FY152_04210 [Agrobacterium tumefaciens]